MRAYCHSRQEGQFIEILACDRRHVDGEKNIKATLK